MFIVTIAGKKQLFINKITDDFLRFLPDQFDVEPEEISAEYIPEEMQKQMRRIMKANPEKRFEFDLDNLKLMEVTLPSAIQGQVNPKHIMNQEPKDDAADELDPKALKKGKFEKLTNEEKIAYLKSITWTPRKWESKAYGDLIGFPSDMYFNNDSPECKPQRKEVAVFTAKKVKAVHYKKVRNTVTGELVDTVDKIELEP